MNPVLVDTGPLVAILSPNDQYHDVCVQALRTMPAPLLTCWPVLTETAWLLKFDPRAVEKLLRSAGTLYRTLPLDDEASAEIAAILKQYRKLRPQLADAALVHLARRKRIETVFTLDQRDFRVYRPRPNLAFNIVP